MVMARSAALLSGSRTVRAAPSITKPRIIFSGAHRASLASNFFWDIGSFPPMCPETFRRRKDGMDGVEGGTAYALEEVP